MALSVPLGRRAEACSSSSQAGLRRSLGTSQPPAGGALGQIFHPTQQSSSCLPLLPCFFCKLPSRERVLKLWRSILALLAGFPAQLRVFQLLDLCVCNSWLLQTAWRQVFTSQVSALCRSALPLSVCGYGSRMVSVVLWFRMHWPSTFEVVRAQHPT